MPNRPYMDPPGQPSSKVTSAKKVKGVCEPSAPQLDETYDERCVAAGGNECLIDLIKTLKVTYGVPDGQGDCVTYEITTVLTIHTPDKCDCDPKKFRKKGVTKKLWDEWLKKCEEQAEKDKKKNK